MLVSNGQLFVFIVMNLIKYENYQITISDDAYLVKSIRKLFNADKSASKEKFFEQMTFIYFSSDVRSDYNYILDDEEKYAAICKGEGLKDFKITNDIKAAMEDYKRLTTTASASLLLDTKIAIDKVRKFLRDVDLTLTDKGKPVYTINSVTSAIKAIPELAKNLMEAEKIVNKEIEEAGRARGGNDTKKLFEDLNFS